MELQINLVRINRARPVTRNLLESKNYGVQKVRNMYTMIFTISAVIQRAIKPSGPFSYVGYISLWQELPGGHRQRGNLCPGSESWNF